MDEVEVDERQPQFVQAGFDGVPGESVGLIGRPLFGCDEEVRAADSRLCDRLANGGVIGIPGGRVEVTGAAFECGENADHCRGGGHMEEARPPMGNNGRAVTAPRRKQA